MVNKNVNYENIHKTIPITSNVSTLANDIENQSSNQSNTTNSFIKYMDDEMTLNDTYNFLCSSLIFIISLIIIITTVVLSYHYVRYDKYTLRLNTYHGADISKVYSEGRYFLTLDNSMIYFPSTYERISFTSSAFSDNGLEFDLNVSFYYRLPKENLGIIYNSYSTSYENKIEANAKQVTKNIASTFSVEEFLSNRTWIEESIGMGLQTQIYQTLKIYVPYNYFKIITITFPSILISKSLDTAIALQTNQIALLQQEVNVIKADTQQMISQIEASTSKIENYALTLSNQIKLNAQSVSTNMLLTSRTDGLDLFCSILNITNPDQINKINKIFNMIDNANNLTLFNTPNNIIYNV
jgi:hypothetical protein